MTADQVQAIRDRVTATEKKAVLAREFGVTRQTIYKPACCIADEQ